MGKLAIYTFLLYFASLSYASVFNWKDAFNYPKFSFEWSPEAVTLTRMEELKSELPNDKLWTRLRTGNEDYFCVYPNITAIKSKSVSKQPKPDTNSIRTQGFKALETLSNIFIMERRGYWAYDYLHNQFVRQYHLDLSPDLQKPVMEPLYFLGMASSQEKNVEPQEQQLLVMFDEGKAYLQTTYRNGTICDVTNKPRTVVLKYECEDDDPTPRFTQYQEVSSCSYSITIHVPALCKHRAFQSLDDSPSENIICYPISTESDVHSRVTGHKSQLPTGTSTNRSTALSNNAEDDVGGSTQPTSSSSDPMEEL
ncbi:sensor for misfolded ER glycoproteins Yos9 [Schizosaccharomyces octosporus yFS286]|uniref:Endoplasmic reticulum lectin n=1 Tax=Schizosaccharomyces octosporus (strain yFS286) TaxID=483514 RepID=S9RA39_SCHOY|nr:sensor for misfolded ER glycoproteins Yos9 [Schizosaccharomyces octosporus yFS286]EPX74995.1 sensor for misfolded ER glycoproteins Yos9 [Schizosaccharomyces octosporus yFS286]